VNGFCEHLLSAFAALALLLAPVAAAAQGTGGSPPAYKPPLRGAPGGRVGGASRGTIKIATPLPEIDLLAPDGESGETTNPAPTLYFYVSLPVRWPTRFTISAPWQPAPVIETAIAAPAAPGIYAVRLADLRVRLQPRIVYTWSISIVTDPTDPAHDIVASASLLRVDPDPAVEAAIAGASPERRAALFAQAGLWYDAIAAAAESGNDGALGALMHEVGLTVPAALAPQP
jgi:Domain of Unknown Function (DUF928)